METLRGQLESARAKLPMVDVSVLQASLKREDAARSALREQYNALVRSSDAVQLRLDQVERELVELKDRSSREVSQLQSDLLRAQFLNEDFQRRLKDLAESRNTLSEQSGATSRIAPFAHRIARITQFPCLISCAVCMFEI